MQALILAGGQGTRLRPLTTTVPKPVLPLAGRPFLTFMIDWLRRHGVDDVVLSCGFLGDAVRDVLGERHRGVRLRYVREEHPLGTAGPVRLALDRGALDERFLVCNGDILTDADLGALMAGHERAGAAATIGLVAVEDTSSYGVVPTAPGGEVEAFLEKTDAPAPTNQVNGGVYVVERAVAEEVPPGRPVSFEREVFPALVGRGLFGLPAEGYWIDIGTPERYLEATYDLLAGVVESDLPPRDESGSLVGAGSVTSGARIGPQSVVGARCSVGAGATVERSVLHERVTVGEEAELREAVVAAGARLGDGVRLEPGAVVGARAEVAAGTVVGRGQRVEPAGVAGGSRVSDLAPESLAAADPSAMLADVLDQPAQLEDALWRVESASVPEREAPGGLVVCGMGGSAIGGDLARACLGERARRPIRVVREFAPGPSIGPQTLVLLASYSGETAETLACQEAARAAGAPCVAVTTGGPLAEAARAGGDPVIGVPAGLQPRAAVAYMTVAALECAAACGAGPRLADEVRGASRLLVDLAAEWAPDGPDDSEPKALARSLLARIATLYGGGPTAAVARRWKTQLNENAKVPAFFSELPEANHNEVCGFEAAELAPLRAIMLLDRSQDERVARRLELTGRAAAEVGAGGEQVHARGDTPFERVASLVLLGDLVSVYLAALRGVDPTPVAAIVDLKRSLNGS